MSAKHGGTVPQANLILDLNWNMTEVHDGNLAVAKGATARDCK
eukprot:CAMPEP_0178605212 /NCGR_PEP_ID=MMETSP0697-20121206/36449_1 /TAXON_ID=265572 /ORGANISM="Extubocellulus spinifer, Strain CCMP396" /LENGTH=42 /DNA_ID= /DNA_START= /DNA_END= /DNA_ORIENTATION=